MICSGCGKSNDDAARFCRYCGSTLHTRKPDGGETLHPDPVTTRYALGKSPTVALLFGIIPVPGLGQFYNGDFKRGVLVLILALIGYAMTPFAPCLSALALGALWVWGWSNAHSVAARKTPLWS